MISQMLKVRQDLGKLGIQQVTIGEKGIFSSMKQVMSCYTTNCKEKGLMLLSKHNSQIGMDKGLQMQSDL